MNPILRISLAASLSATLLAACAPVADSAVADEANFTRPMQAYLAIRGDLCVGRGSWPVDVTLEEAVQGSRNALQLPVLERLGLVKSTAVQVEAGNEVPHRTDAATRSPKPVAGSVARAHPTSARPSTRWPRTISARRA